MKSKHSISKLALVLAIVLISSFVFNNITVHAVESVVEADYADPNSPRTQSDDRWYSTYAAGAGYKGQGVLMYLLERDGGTAVTGTTPVAFPCTPAMLNYDLKATPKYGGYATVTTWQNFLPSWAGEVATNQGGALIKSNGRSNVADVKAWLQLPYGDGTKGINMVQQIWGDAIATRFTHEEIILVVEPIIAIQYSECCNSKLTISEDDTLTQMLVELERFRTALRSFPNTAISNDLENWLSNYLDNEYFEHIPAGSKEDMCRSLYNEYSTGVFSMNFYQKLGDPLAGTANELINYYNSLSPSTDKYVGIKSFTNGDFYKSESGYKWYRNYAQRAAYVKTGSIVCANANMNLWPASQNPAFTHSQASILNDRYTTGMLAMLARTNDDGSSTQTTCNEPEQPAPHDPPNESTGTYTIIKTYRDRNSITNQLVHVDTTHRSNVHNQILIEDESEYTVVAWKIASQQNLSIQGPTWESSVPGHIQESGTDTGLVECDPTHKYLYVLLEKGNGTLNANYNLSQSQLTRHITINNPDNPTVNGTTMVNLSSLSFNWTIGAHTRTGCSGHRYYDGCHNSCPNNHSCGTRCFDNNTPLGVIFLLKIIY